LRPPAGTQQVKTLEGAHSTLPDRECGEGWRGLHEAGVTVRPPREGDEEGLANLILRFYSLNEEFDPAWSLARDARERAASVARRYIAGSEGLVLLAEVEGRLAGYVRAVRREYPLLENPLMLVIEELYVLPQFRGRGIGRVLIAEVERAARSMGAGAVAAEVPAKNTVALSLYNGQGFRELARVYVKQV